MFLGGLTNEILLATPLKYSNIAVLMKLSVKVLKICYWSDLIDRSL